MLDGTDLLGLHVALHPAHCRDRLGERYVLLHGPSTSRDSSSPTPDSGSTLAGEASVAAAAPRSRRARLCRQNAAAVNPRPVRPVPGAVRSTDPAVKHTSPCHLAGRRPIRPPLNVAPRGECRKHAQPGATGTEGAGLLLLADLFNGALCGAKGGVAPHRRLCVPASPLLRRVSLARAASFPDSITGP